MIVFWFPQISEMNADVKHLIANVVKTAKISVISAISGQKLFVVGS